MDEQRKKKGSNALRGLAKVCVVLIAIPIVYIVGIYAVVLGSYAIVAVFSLFNVLIQGVPLKSSENFVAFVLYVAIALLVLAVGFTVLYGIWRGIRLLIKKMRTI